MKQHQQQGLQQCTYLAYTAHSSHHLYGLASMELDRTFHGPAESFHVMICVMAAAAAAAATAAMQSSWLHMAPVHLPAVSALLVHEPHGPCAHSCRVQPGVTVHEAVHATST